MTTTPSVSIKKSTITHLWSRLTTTRWEDAWRERLQFAGPEFLVLKAFPASRTLRLDVYTNKATAQKLLKNFGGSVRPFNAATWTPPASKNKHPRHIGTTLLLYNDEKSFLQDCQKTSSKKRLYIPAGMAFGTGDHATTSNCLRLLENIQKLLPPKKWSLLDLGTGSGILALAGASLGAKKILGIDFDQQCVSIAQENALRNNLSHIRFRHANLLHWTPPGTWDVVTANIYSSVLSTAAAKIVNSINTPGHLILSGILVVERTVILDIFMTLGMKEITYFQRGKWCALLLQKINKDE
ncbi:MAG: 50S ribosomal protein L11 methyltransferase [Chthoniobacterales bacterium]|nr:50S ribosomal protein L11 methyltransferase [Chthoniobacterales bacterium]